MELSQCVRTWKYSQMTLMCNGNQAVLNNNIKRLQGNMAPVISRKCCYACYFFWRCSSSVCSLCIKVSRRQLPWDVQMFPISFVFCYLREKSSCCFPSHSTSPSLASPFSPHFSLALPLSRLHWSPTNWWGFFSWAPVQTLWLLSYANAFCQWN